MTQNLVPRNFWDVTNFRMPSIFDDMNDNLSMLQNDTPSGLSISEDDKNVYVEAALPGIDPKNIEVTFDRGMLWIRGEAKEEEKDKKRTFYRRATQAYAYSVTIPAEVDQNTEPQASYENGMLRVTLSKVAQKQPKKLTIKLGGKGSKESK